MATLEHLLSQGIIERLGWTLVHFVWQATAVTLLLAAILRLLRNRSAGLRYIVSCLALTLIVALPLVTMQLVEVSGPVAEAGPEPIAPPAVTAPPIEVIEVAELPVESIDAPALEMTNVTVPVPWKQRMVSAFEPALPWLVLSWLVGVFGLSAWHLGGWAQLQRMKQRMVREVAVPLEAKLAELAERLGVQRAVGLLESALVEVPTVVGWIKPVILLPASTLTGLNTEQLEAILAHELAHIRRYDYLVNIAQTVVEILGFYHPALWWISHRIRDERENCCDDLAVQVCGDSVRYARALTCLEEMRHRGSELAVAANGGNLVARISRLLGRPTQDDHRFTWLPGLIALLLIAATVIPTALVLAGPELPVERPAASLVPENGQLPQAGRARLTKRLEERQRESLKYDPMVQELAKKIAEIEVDLIVAQQTLAPAHPTIVEKKQLLAAFNNRLAERRRELGQSSDDHAVTSQDSRGSAPVRVLAKTADENESSTDEKTQILLDIEIVEAAGDRRLTPETAARLSRLWDQMDAKRRSKSEGRVSLPKIEELQVAPAQLLDRYAENGYGDSDTLEIMGDLLQSLKYLKVILRPQIQVLNGKQTWLEIVSEERRIMTRSANIAYWARKSGQPCLRRSSAARW